MTDTVLYSTLIGSDEPIEELPAEIISYGFRLNGPGSIRFRLAADHPKCDPAVIYPRRHEAVVRRNGAIVWRGPILTAVETDSTSGRFVEFAGEGMLSYLRWMHVTATIGVQAATEQFAVAAALVDHHQSKAGGDFGIDTSSVGAAGIEREGLIYPGFERKNVWEAVVQLAERLNGFDFDVAPETRVLRLHHPSRGRRRPDIVFDVRNIRSFGRTIDGTAQASQVLGVGAGEADSMLLRSRQSSTAVADFGLTQTIVTAKDVSVADTLQDKVDDELAAHTSPPEVISVTSGTTDPPVMSYEEGDEVRIVWDSPYSPISAYRRLVGRDIQWTAGEEQAVLHLEAL